MKMTIVTLRATEKNVGSKDKISEVSESSLRSSVRNFLSPPDVLTVCTAGPKYQVRLYGQFAALWFVSHEEGWL